MVTIAQQQKWMHFYFCKENNPCVSPRDYSQRTNSFACLFLKNLILFSMVPEEKEKKEGKIMTNLEKFLSSYSTYLTESTALNMDL